jgi:hypothetical protein
MRKAIFDRDIYPVWKTRRLAEITPDDLRAQCIKVKERGAPATAIHVRDIMRSISPEATISPAGSSVTCPNWGQSGPVHLSQPEGRVYDMSVEAIPAGFKVVRTAFGETFFCGTCDRQAVTNYPDQLYSRSK